MLLIDLLQFFIDILNIWIQLSFSNSDLLVLVLLIRDMKHNPFLSPAFDIYEIHYDSPPAFLTNNFLRVWSFPLFSSRLSIVGFISFLRAARKTGNTFQVRSSHLLVQYADSFVWSIHKVRKVMALPSVQLSKLFTETPLLICINKILIRFSNSISGLQCFLDFIVPCPTTNCTSNFLVFHFQQEASIVIVTKCSHHSHSFFLHVLFILKF